MDALLDQIGAVVGGILGHPLIRLLTAAVAVYIVVVWLASTWWVFRDLRRRVPDPIAPYVAATGVILTTPVLFPLALVVYWILRPSETLLEIRERRLAERLDELEEDAVLACPGCERIVDADWLLCSFCRTRLAHRCVHCGRTMGLDWSLCAWCGQEFGHPVLAQGLPRPARAGVRRAQEGRTAAREGRALRTGA